VFGFGSRDRLVALLTLSQAPRRAVTRGPLRRSVGAAADRGLTFAARQADERAADEKRKTREELDAMLSFGGDTPDRKHASFRLMGDDLDPAAITSALGIKPSMSHRKDDQRKGESGTRRWRSGLWDLDSEDALAVAGTHLEDHLCWLLDRLDPHAATVRRLIADRGLRADFWCGYFMGQANSSVGSSAGTLERMAALGAALSLDIYAEHVEMELESWVKRAP